MNRSTPPSPTITRARAALVVMTATLAMLALSCSFSGLSLSKLSSPRPPPGIELKFDRWRQKSVHNAYAQGEGLREQLEQHRFRSVELDLHIGKLAKPRVPGDWYVYHVDFPGLDGSSCPTLSACLAEIDAYHRARPDHEVLTVFLDMKDAFAGEGHLPASLDAQIARSLDPNALWGPRQMLDRCPEATTLREAVTGECRWPTLGELRGKIVIALTGGVLCAPGSRLAVYARDGLDANHRAAFVAPNVDESCPFERNAERAPYAVFFNLDFDSLSQAGPIARAGLVSRAYYGGVTGGLDEPEVWDKAAQAGVQFLATDRVDPSVYPWTDN